MGQCPKVDYTANVYGGLGGVCRFSMQYLWIKVRTTEKPYTPPGERLCMLWGNPIFIYRLQGNPIVIIGVSPRHT